MMKTLNGKCLCGAVTVSLTPKREAFGVCHCGMCQRWGGGPSISVQTDGEASFTGKDSITTFESSAWAERGFCKKCGTHLFYRMKGGGFMGVPLGLLDNANHLKFENQIFIDRKPEQYSFANKTPVMTEAEVFAMYAPKS